MLSSITDYWGTELFVLKNDVEGLEDLKKIEAILKKNKVTVGGYDSDIVVPEIEYSDNQATLYLGR